MDRNESSVGNAQVQTMNGFNRALTAFDRFLFDAHSPALCSLIRISYAGVLLVLVSFWIIDADKWFTESGVLRAQTASESFAYPSWSIFFVLPPRVEFVYAGLGILFVQSLLLALGCWSRVQCVGIFLLLTSFQHRNLLICDGEDTVFRLFAFFMVFMPLDHAWSLGRTWYSRKNGCPSGVDSLQIETTAADLSSSAWALRLMQFQLTAIYASTAWSKWQGTAWRDGTALYYVSRMDDVFGRFWMPAFVFENPWIYKSATWGVLGLETALPFMLWYRPTRWIAIILAACLHLAIEYSMHLFLFEWIMLVGLLSFIRPSEWRLWKLKPTMPLSLSPVGDAEVV